MLELPYQINQQGNYIMNFNDTILMDTKLLDNPFLSIENFEVRSVSNGWVVEIGGYVTDLEDDYSDDPRTYERITIVTSVQDELADLLAYLVTVERHQD